MTGIGARMSSACCPVGHRRRKHNRDRLGRQRVPVQRPGPTGVLKRVEGADVDDERDAAHHPVFHQFVNQSPEPLVQPQHRVPSMHEPRGPPSRLHGEQRSGEPQVKRVGADARVRDWSRKGTNSCQVCWGMASSSPRSWRTSRLRSDTAVGWPHSRHHTSDLGRSRSVPGPATTLQEWSSGVETFTCSEAEPNRLAALRARFEGRSDIEVVELVIPIEVEGDHSAVVAYNVLEHIPDDVEALKAMAGLVAPGGKVVVIVPAAPFAMSRFDVEIGHQRRYTRRSLAATLNHAGLETEILHYVNPVGLVAWVVLMKLMRQRPRAGMALSAYDRFLVPVLMRLESRRHPPLGQSLFAVARKPT